MTPATEKAAPIPADVLAIARLASIEIGEWVVDRSRKHPRDIVADLILADRASQGERIREDERDRLYEKAGRRMSDPALQNVASFAQLFLSCSGAMPPSVRARLRGDAS